jgi:hypothetical protein
MGVFVKSPVPPFLLESLLTAGSLRSTAITPLHSYAGPSATLSPSTVSVERLAWIANGGMPCRHNIVERFLPVNVHHGGLFFSENKQAGRQFGRTLARG